MIRRADTTVSDSLGTPEPGVYITVKTNTGALATLYDDAGAVIGNPLLSGLGGAFYYNIADAAAGTYTEEYRLSLLASPRTIRTVLLDPSVNPANLQTAATRTILAAIVAPGAGATRHLTEAGREGDFVFNTANLSAMVTADPQQGVYVAPASAATGASGAWVRTGWKELKAEWFGAVFDNVTNDAAAIAAAITLSKALAGNVSANGFYKVGPTVTGPAGTTAFMGATTLDITHTVKLKGEGPSGQQNFTGGLRLRWSDGCEGIRTQRYNTSALATIDGVTHFGGDCFTLEDVALIGGYVATESESHAFHPKARFNLRNVRIEGWSGDGIFSNADGAGGGASQGNTNNSRIDTVHISSCRNGLSVTGGDSNAWTVLDLDRSGNRSFGVKDTSFLGNHYFGGHSADNGLIPGTAPSVVSNGGNRYAVVYGAEATASVTAPVGTADTANWYYIGAGGVNAPANIPAWVNGMTLRAGGAGLYNNANSQAVIFGSYTESGQGPVQGTYGAQVIGGQQGAQVKGTITYLLNRLGTLTANLIGAIDTSQFGPTFQMPNASYPIGKLGWYSSYGDYSIQGFNGDYCWTILNSAASASWAFRLTGEATAANIGKRLLDFPNGFGFADKKRFPAVAAPATARVVGDVDENTAPTLVAPLKWVTIAAGTPGTLFAHYPYPRADPLTGIGYLTGAGGAVAQITSRTTTVVINKVCGAITLVSAAGSAAFQSFSVSNSTVAATDTIIVSQKSGADKYQIFVTNVAAGGFQITFATTGGVTVETPVFNFAVVKAVSA